MILVYNRKSISIFHFFPYFQLSLKIYKANNLILSLEKKEQQQSRSVLNVRFKSPKYTIYHTIGLKRLI